jgi:hypothetical protein
VERGVTSVESVAKPSLQSPTSVTIKELAQKSQFADHQRTHTGEETLQVY